MAYFEKPGAWTQYFQHLTVWGNPDNPSAAIVTQAIPQSFGPQERRIRFAISASRRLRQAFSSNFTYNYS